MNTHWLVCARDAIRTLKAITSSIVAKTICSLSYVDVAMATNRLHNYDLIKKQLYSIHRLIFLGHLDQCPLWKGLLYSAGVCCLFLLDK